MVAGTYATRQRLSAKNGFTPGSNGFLSHGRKNENYVAELLDDFEETPFHAAVMTYLSYFFLIIFGYLRDFMRKYGLEKSKAAKETGNEVGDRFNFKSQPRETNDCRSFACTCKVMVKNSIIIDAVLRQSSTPYNLLSVSFQ